MRMKCFTVHFTNVMCTQMPCSVLERYNGTEAVLREGEGTTPSPYYYRGLASHGPQTFVEFNLTFGMNIW